MEKNLQNQLGQKMGPKGRITRQKILDRVHILLGVSPYKELSIADVAYESGVSAATFYTYFKDLNDLFYACSLEATVDIDWVLEVFHQDWDSKDPEACIRNFVEAHMKYWDKHHHELRILCIESDSGNIPFVKLRVAMSNRIIEALGEKLKAFRPELSNHFMLAAVIYTAMERLASIDRKILASFADRRLPSGLHIMTRKNVNHAIIDILNMISTHNA